MINDTIARCFHQSGGVIRTVDGATYTYTDEGFDYEKFAKLIVDECVNQIKKQYLPVMEDAVMMNDEHWKGYKHCGVDSVVAIKEHFGVEE